MLVYCLVFALLEPPLASCSAKMRSKMRRSLAWQRVKVQLHSWTPAYAAYALSKCIHGAGLLMAVLSDESGVSHQLQK